MPLSSLDLNETTTEGILWKSRPVIHNSGLMSVVKNRKHREEDMGRPPFLVCGFNKTGDVVAAADPLGQVWAFFVRENKYHRVKLPGPAVTLLEFSKTRSRELFVALEDCSVVCYDVKSKRVYATLRAHKWPVHSVAFHPSGDTFASASEEQCILWDNSDWTRRSCLTKGGGITKVDFASCSRYGLLLLAAFSNGTIIGWNMNYEQKLKLSPPSADQVPSASQHVNAFSVSPDKKLLVSVGESGQANLWDLESQKLSRVLDLGSSIHSIHYTKWFPNSKGVISLGNDGHIIFANIVENCRILFEIVSRDSSFLCCATDRNHKFLVGGLADGSLRFYDLSVVRREAKRGRYHVGDVNHSDEKNATVKNPGFLLSQSRTENSLEEDENNVGDNNETLPMIQRQQALLERLQKGDNNDDSINTSAPSKITRDFTKESGIDKETAIARAAFLDHNEDKKHSDELFDNIFPQSNHGKEEDMIVKIQNGMENEENSEFNGQWTTLKRRKKPKLHLRERMMASARRKAMARNIVEEEQDVLEPLPRPPLQRLADVSDANNEVNETALLRLLKCHGEFPRKHRLLCWRFLLRLPENRIAFDALSSRGLHTAFRSLPERYPIKNRRLLGRLTRLLSALAHWSPVFAEVPHLPVLSFPFIKTTATSEDVVSFEILACIMLHWCKGWYANIPGPPVILLESFERSLSHHDPTLHRHFINLGIAGDDYCWPLLQSVFSEVLTRPQWLSLWDNLIAHWREPSLLPLCVLAYIRLFRTALLGLHRPNQVREFLRRQNAVDVKRILKMAHGYLKNSPPHMIPSAIEFELGEAGGKGDGIHPILSRGQYPAFVGFPRAVVDFQAARRRQIEAEEDRVAQQKKKILALAEITASLEQERNKFERTRELLEASEKERAEADERITANLLEERQNLAHAMRQRRLDHLAARERAAVEAVRGTRLRMEKNAKELTLWLKNQELSNKQDIERLREEEALQNLEFQSDQRVAELQEEAMQQQSLQDLKTQLKIQLQKMEREDVLKHEEWKREDEERQLRRRVELEKQQKIVQMEKQLEVQRELLSEIEMKRLKHQEKTLAVERERRLRHLAEDELKMAQAAVEEQKKSEELLLLEEQRQQRQLIQQRQDAIKKRDEDRADELRRAREAHEEKSRRWKERMADIQASHRKQEWEEKVRAIHKEAAARATAEDEAMEKQLEELGKEHAKQQELEQELLFRDMELKERIAFAKAQEKLEEKILLQEGIKRDKKLHEFRHSVDEKLREARRKHEEKMAKLIERREQQLLKLQSDMRAKLRGKRSANDVDVSCTSTVEIEKSSATYGKNEDGKETKAATSALSSLAGELNSTVSNMGESPASVRLFETGFSLGISGAIDSSERAENEGFENSSMLSGSPAGAGPSSVVTQPSGDRNSPSNEIQ
eukprot:g122.t1